MKREAEILAAVKKVHTIPEILDSIIGRYGTEIIAARTNRNGKISAATYGELQRDALCLASFLEQKNLSGQSIAVVGKLSYEWLVVFFAILYSGNIVVPIDKDLGAKEIAGAMLKVNAKALLIDVCLSDKAIYLKKSFLDMALFFSFSEYREGEIAGFRNIRTLPGPSLNKLKLDPGQDAIYVFTSGTTGDNKAVMLSHQNVTANLAGCMHVFEAEYGPGTTIQVLLPPHHMFGITVGILSPMFYGAALGLGGGVRNLTNNAKVYRPNNFIFVPMAAEAMYNKIIAEVKRKGVEKKFARGIKISQFLRKIGIDLRRKLFKEVLAEFGGNFKTFICGGAYLEPYLIDRFEEIGVELRNGYGISECSPTVAHSTKTEFRKGSVGKALPQPYIEVKIIEGEICVKGTCVFRGYYNDEEATRKAFTSDGWFKTGDLGYIDDDGYIWISGRKKNLIILSDGNNIAPEEIEGYFREIPLVKAVIVYGEKKAQNTLIAALVHPDYDYAKSANIADLEAALQKEIDKINENLPVYKQIEKIRLQENDFERTSIGKIKRHKHITVIL